MTKRWTLTLTIGDTQYDVTNLDPPPGMVKSAFRLTKADGTQYTVAVDCYGPTCDCGDATWRKRNGDLCKHASAMLDAGVLPWKKPKKMIVVCEKPASPLLQVVDYAEEEIQDGMEDYPEGSNPLYEEPELGF